MEKFMIKIILVPTSGSDTDARVFSAALSIARPLSAHLQFFHVRLSACEAAVRTRHVEFCVGPAINSALNFLDKDQAVRSGTAIERARAFCAKEGVPFRDRPSTSHTVTAES
jgi:hypothetical protein